MAKSSWGPAAATWAVFASMLDSEAASGAMAAAGRAWLMHTSVFEALVMDVLGASVGGTTTGTLAGVVAGKGSSTGSTIAVIAGPSG